MIVKISPNKNPPEKLAEAELHFTDGPLDGMKLVGFAVWAPRGTSGKRSVTFPSRQYSVNAEKRSFALLRAITNDEAAERVRQLVLDAYTAWEAQ